MIDNKDLTRFIATCLKVDSSYTRDEVINELMRIGLVQEKDLAKTLRLRVSIILRTARERAYRKDNPAVIAPTAAVKIQTVTPVSRRTADEQHIKQLQEEIEQRKKALQQMQGKNKVLEEAIVELSRMLSTHQDAVIRVKDKCCRVLNGNILMVIHSSMWTVPQ